MAKKAKDPNKKTIGQEFKEFISRGNVLDMAVGVIIGGAFSAIVTAVVSILMSVCTWWVPGGIKGLVTVLPAITDSQRGMDEKIGLGSSFDAGDLQSLGIELAKANYADNIAADPSYLLNNPNLIESAKSTILSKYTLHGKTYTYNLAAVIDWGTFINAVISFLIIAVVLFTIIKLVNKFHEVRDEAKAKVEEKIVKKEADEAKAE